MFAEKLWIRRMEPKEFRGFNPIDAHRCGICGKLFGPGGDSEAHAEKCCKCPVCLEPINGRKRVDHSNCNLSPVSE